MNKYKPNLDIDSVEIYYRKDGSSLATHICMAIAVSLFLIIVPIAVMIVLGV